MTVSLNRPPTLPVRLNKRHDFVKLNEMNGEKLLRLRHRKTTEFSRTIKSLNSQLSVQLKKDVALWFKNQNVALSNYAKSQKKIYHDINFYHIEKRKIKRDEHIKHQAYIRETMEKLRIKRIARKVVEKFRENVYRKKAMRNARRRSKRGTLSGKMPRANSAEKSDSDISENKSRNSGRFQDDHVDKVVNIVNSSLSHLTVENVERLEKLHSDAVRQKQFPYKSAYLEASKSNTPTSQKTKAEKKLELPPLKRSIKRSGIQPPSKTYLLNTIKDNERVLAEVYQANEPKFVMPFESIPEGKFIEENENDNVHTWLNRQDCQTNDTSDDYNKHTVVKQSVLNRLKRKREAAYRNKVLNEELPVFYRKTYSGELVVSEVGLKKTVFNNHTGLRKYKYDKLRLSEQQNVATQQKQIEKFYNKLQNNDDTHNIVKTETKNPPYEDKTPKFERRQSLSISTLLNRPFAKTEDDADMLKNCSYIRDYEPVLSEKDKQTIRQRKKSSWQVPMSQTDQSHLASLHQSSLADFSV